MDTLDELPELAEEVLGMLEGIGQDIPGEHIWSNYQTIVAKIVRLQEIHNQISLLEITGRADTEIKRFRTMIVDPTIERLEKVAAFESRKITALSMEMNLDK